MEEPWRDGTLEIGRGKAEDIGIEDKPRAFAGTEGVAVHADNAGEGSAIRVEG